MKGWRVPQIVVSPNTTQPASSTHNLCAGTWVAVARLNTPLWGKFGDLMVAPVAHQLVRGHWQEFGSGSQTQNAKVKPRNTNRSKNTDRTQGKSQKGPHNVELKGKFDKSNLVTFL